MNKAPFPVRFTAIVHRIFLAFSHLFLKATAGAAYLIHYRPRYDIPREVRWLRTPYIVLSDHVHPRDMVMNGWPLLPVVHWVAADANFRTPFSKFAMTVILGTVAKSKNRSDMVTLSRLKLLTDIGSVIGIYQEGERSWDGVSLPPVKGTDKLIRFLKVPVVYVHFEGAFLEHPRWTWKGNKTRINVRYEVIIGKDEVQTMPLSEISQRITAAGTYDEWAYQAKAQEPLKGEKRAENLELVCFLCPGCLSVNTLHSEGNNFSCSCCGLEGAIDRMGSFSWPDTRDSGIWPDGKPFLTVREWNVWQRDYYREEIRKVYDFPGDESGLPGTPAEHLFWEDKNVVLVSRGKRGRQMKAAGIGSARYYQDRIELETEELQLAIPLDDISGFSVFKQFYTEFYFEKQLYQLSFTSRSISGYKWLMLFQMILEWKQKRL